MRKVSTHSPASLVLPRKLYDTIEQKVVSLYYEHNIKELPIQPFEIARNRSYILRPYSELNIEVCNLLREKKQGGTSYVDPESQNQVICFDDLQPLCRQRFTIMHEIGHIDMGHKHGSQLAEIIANHYAGYALAPSPLIKKFNCEDFEDIAIAFHISEECAYWRFNSYQNWLKFKIKKNYEAKLLSLLNTTKGVDVY